MKETVRDWTAVKADRYFAIYDAKCYVIVGRTEISARFIPVKYLITRQLEHYYDYARTTFVT
jgi:hypothetical protein